MSSKSCTTDARNSLRTIAGDAVRALRTDEVRTVCEKLRETIALRHKYMPDRGARPEDLEAYAGSIDPSEDVDDPFLPQPTAGGLFSFEMRRGVVVVWREMEATKSGLRAPGWTESSTPCFQPPSFSAYTRDLDRLIEITSDAAVNSFCYRRLQKLEARFKLHVMEREQEEALGFTKSRADTPLPQFACISLKGGENTQTCKSSAAEARPPEELS